MIWGRVARAALGPGPLRPPLGPSAVGSRGIASSRAFAALRGTAGSIASAELRGLLGSRPTVPSRGLASRADSDGASDVTEPPVTDVSTPVVRRATWRRSLSPAARLATLLGPHSLSPDTDTAAPETEGLDCRSPTETQPNASVTDTDKDTRDSVQYTDEDSQPNTTHVGQETRPSITHIDEKLQPNVTHTAKQTQPSSIHTAKEMVGEGCEGERAMGDDQPLGSAERCLGVGHLVLVENRKGNVVKMQKMLKLKEGGCLRTMWGALQHDELVGRMPGVAVKASDGARFVVRRPSLHEFTLFMPRTAAIAYPKDVSAMLMHLDLRPGDVVLEAGSGSGAMTLMLSGAVWERGRVVSCDVNGDHLHVAQRNVSSWRAAWAQARGLDSWPRNISFLKADVLRDTHLTQRHTYDAVVLDMLNVHLAVSCVLPALKSGGVIMIYVANITQAVDVAATVQAERLPASVELVLEVSHRGWVIIPALHKDGRPYTRPTRVAELAEEDARGGFETPAVPTSRPFVCRPNSEQYGHTAFLIKLRKILPE